MHTGEGVLTAAGLADFLADNPEASAHAAADAGGVVAPLVSYDRAAWTAGPTANSRGLHIELAAFAAMSRDDWLSDQDRNVWVPWLNANRHIRSPLSMLRHTAAWVRDRCAEFGIPVVKLSAADLRAGKRGICGHGDSSAAWGETDHTDPGPGFPWPEFIALVQGQQEDDVSAADVTQGLYDTRVDGRNLYDWFKQLRAEQGVIRDQLMGQIVGLQAAVTTLAGKVGTGGGASAAEIEAAVAQAIRENTVKVDVSVQGGGV